MSAQVNDFTVGYARARRDLGCIYTIGFYDRNVKEDKSHELRVESAVPGVTVRHAASYSFPSRASRRQMAVQAAFMVPTMFEGGGMRAQVFPLEPHDKKTWDAIVAIDFPMPLDPRKGPSRREFGAVLKSGPVVAKSFSRSVTVDGSASDDGANVRRLTFVEPALISPGNYELTAVVSDPGGESPFTAHAELNVPPVPSSGPFLVGPVIGRRSGPDIVIHGREDARGAPADRIGGAGGFRPLIVTETDRTQPLFALTDACLTKKDVKHGPWTIARILETSGGDPAGSLMAALRPERTSEAFVCERFADEVPVSRLRWGGYTFQSALSYGAGGLGGSIEAREAKFLLKPAEGTTAAPTGAPLAPEGGGP